MSARLHYVCGYVLDGHRAHFLWFTNDTDGVQLTPAGRLLTFTTETALKDHAQTCGLNVAAEPAVWYDLDQVAEWCEAPTADAIDCHSLRQHGLSMLTALTLAACAGDASSRRTSASWALLLDRGGIAAYVDTARIVRSDSVARVWLRFDHDATMPKMESTTGPWSTLEAETDLDCRGKRARDVRVRLLDRTGAVVGDTALGPSPWQPFTEHSLRDHILLPACDAIR